MELIVALKLYLNSWKIKGVATTPKKKTRNDGVEMCAQSYCET
jgi:hypothetical protein